MQERKRFKVFLFLFIRHEVADIAGLVSFSFGMEEEDRYVMIWKKVCTQRVKQ